MAFATINDNPVISARICMPRVGSWHVDAVVDTQESLEGAVELAIEDGLTLVGTATRAANWLDTGYIRMAAGSDGLRKTVTPKHYSRTHVRNVLADIMRASGDSLSAESDSSVLGLDLTAWTLIQQPIGSAISSLLADTRMPADVAWRMLPDGTLWVGVETWPDSGLVDVDDFQDIDEVPHQGRIELGIEAPRLLPGTLLAGRRVSYVEHRIDAEKTRSAVWVA